MALNFPYQSPDMLPEKLAIFPLQGVLLLPGREMPLNIFEPRYLAMIDDALKTSRVIGMVQPSAERGGLHNAPALHKIGCCGRITQFCETGDGRYIVALTGVCRFRIVSELDCVTPYRQCHVDYTPCACDLSKDKTQMRINRKQLITSLKLLMEAHDMQLDWSEVETMPTDILINGLAMICPCGSAEKQALLEADTLQARAEVLLAIAEIGGARMSGQATPLQ